VAKKWRDLRKALHRAGWHPVQAVGSHEKWRSPDGIGMSRSSWGHENQEVAAGTLGSIRRTTGMKELR
jgi:predicted RNA binding protein YcfA (HicA-like mRNA interferase family)